MNDYVTLAEMLEARDRRVERQASLLQAYQLPMVSFTMNIAGPVKNGPEIRRGFALGREILLSQLARVRAEVVHREEIDEKTGCEGYFVVNMPAKDLKALTTEIEEHTDAGRLFDMDVLAPSGEKLERPVARKCLICGKPARDCARSRTHSVPELQEKTKEILEKALLTHDAEKAAALAVRALLFEVSVTTKPGLVDRRGNGSHKDMDFFTFMASSSVLYPYLAQCFTIGQQTAYQEAPETFKALRVPGKLAEGTMLSATGGVNTHKGAIFTMGIVCGALGRLAGAGAEEEASGAEAAAETAVEGAAETAIEGAVETAVVGAAGLYPAKWRDPAGVLAEVAAMTEGIEKDFEGLTEENALTAGQKFYVRYGITGVRGQAASGFPTVLNFGLPALEEGLAKGLGYDTSGAAALLAILAHTTDTNMISRGGRDLQMEKTAALLELLASNPYPDGETLAALDREYTAANLSPGGSADLLALSFLLHFLKEDM